MAYKDILVQIDEATPPGRCEIALETDCDLIVMGVYGHTRQREYVLSEVSRNMLQNAPAPLLISH